MAWEPIEVTEEDIRAFAAKALEFAGSLDEHGRLPWREIMVRAGGDRAGSDAP